MEEETKAKIAIYGGNFLVPSIIARPLGIKLLNNAANPFGALIYGSLDIASRLSPKFNQSTFLRLARFAGVLYYGGSTVLDAFHIAKGDSSYFVKLPFDASMASVLLSDVTSHYRNHDLLDDFGKIAEKGKGLSSKLKTA